MEFDFFFLHCLSFVCPIIFIFDFVFRLCNMFIYFMNVCLCDFSGLLRFLLTFPTVLSPFFELLKFWKMVLYLLTRNLMEYASYTRPLFQLHQSLINCFNPFWHSILAHHQHTYLIILVASKKPFLCKPKDFGPKSTEPKNKPKIKLKIIICINKILWSKH